MDVAEKMVLMVEPTTARSSTSRLRATRRRRQGRDPAAAIDPLAQEHGASPEDAAPVRDQFVRGLTARSCQVSRFDPWKDPWA
jgi:hypothetical protein